jgi:hypothetical protein
MRWQEFIDGYDCKARLVPTAITLLPSLCTVYYFWPVVLSNPMQLAGSSMFAFALIYLASMFIRDRGVRYAKRFWHERGGLPSTRLGRMRDAFLSTGQKNRIHSAVLRRFGIALLSEEEESEYPALADRKIGNAFREIKEFLRRHEGCGLIEKHSAEYGFMRNLCGARLIFAVQVVGGMGICGFRGNWPHFTLTRGCLVNLILLIVWMPFAWVVLPEMLMLSADIYARRVWVTFLSLSDEPYKKPSTSVIPVTIQRRTVD